MKKTLLASIAAVVCLQANAQNYSHATVPVTGFNADVIADGSGPVSGSTSADIDGEFYNLIAQNYVNPGGGIPTTYLPNSGLINSASTPRLTYQLAAYNTNNSLRLTTTNNTGSLTLTTPRTADILNLLVTTAYGCSFTATVNFSDGTSQVFTATNVPNWFDGTAALGIKGIGRVQKVNNTIENNTNNPRLYQYAIPIAAGNSAKLIQSISFNKTTTGIKEVLHIFAVSASNAIQNDIALTGITAPTSPFAPNVSQPVMVTVKNIGGSPLNSATMGFSVNGTTVSNNFAFTASPPLAQNAVATSVAIGNYNFPKGTHKIKAWSMLPNGIADGFAR